jgi:predicted neutral ceramidase superfamily lipid hydrolase
MEKAKKGGESLAIDCHNCETGEVDYIEPGSPESFEMSDALDDALRQKKLLSPMLAGWACAYPNEIHGIASGGIKVCCFGSKSKRPLFVILLDANGILNEAREKLILALNSKYPGCGIDICTSDTHELNAVKGVFNPVGEQDYSLLEVQILSLANEAHSKLSPCEFGMAKPRIALKVLGPYQSSEIVSTINAVISLLKVAVPIILLAAIFAAVWLLGKL